MKWRRFSISVLAFLASLAGAYGAQRATPGENATALGIYFGWFSFFFFLVGVGAMVWFLGESENL